MKYKIYTDKSLLVDVLEGSFEITDLERIFHHEISDTNFRFVKKISNITNAQLNISAGEIKKFADFMVSPGADPTFRWAILTSNPKQTALSFLIRENKFFNPIVCVFSTLEACAQFLDITVDNECFNEEEYIILDSLEMPPPAQLKITEPKL